MSPNKKSFKSFNYLEILSKFQSTKLANFLQRFLNFFSTIFFYRVFFILKRLLRWLQNNASKRYGRMYLPMQNNAISVIGINDDSKILSDIFHKCNTIRILSWQFVFNCNYRSSWVIVSITSLKKYIAQIWYTWNLIFKTPISIWNLSW